MNRVIQARADELGIGFDEMRDRYLEKTALGRMVSQGDIADMALFLCLAHGPQRRRPGAERLRPCHLDLGRTPE